MPIPLDEPKTAGTPVVKRQRLGETFVGAVVRQHQRQVLKDGKPVVRDDGKPRQELVLTLIAMPGTNAEAGIGGEQSPIQPGDVVRLILRGGAFGEWIEAKKTHGTLNVGDVVTQTTTFGQAYSADGRPVGGKLTTQAECDRVPRNQSLGIYGPISLRTPTPAEAEWVTKAEEQYMATKDRVPADDGHDGDPEPF